MPTNPGLKKKKTTRPWSSRLDANVGELVDLLKKKGIAENTLIIFAGDNGSSFAPNTPLGKTV